MAPSETYAFGRFTLDVAERRLSRDGEAIALAPKAFDLLVALVRRAGRLAGKRELLGSVWPDSFVEEGILTVHISTLRKALGDTSRPPRVIETVARSGYRFNAPVIAQTPRAGRTHPDVYELCGRGRQHLLSASMFEVRYAVEAFKGAVAMDPSYAPALAGLALAHCAEAAMRVVPPADAYREARGAALRALAVDDRSADAQVALGTVLFFAEWDWRGAEECFRRAVEINPSHVQGYLIYGRLLDALERPHEALEMKLRAFECDPLSPLVHVQIALCHWNQRRYDDAMAWANKALALDPKHLLAREFLAGAYLKMGDCDRYVAEAIQHGVAAGVAPEALEPLRTAYAAGARAGARYSLEQLKGNKNAPAIVLAIFSGEAGEIDAAFRHLDRAILDHDPSLVDLAVGPQWDCLRNDPRFERCLAQLGLPRRSAEARRRGLRAPQACAGDGRFT